MNNIDFLAKILTSESEYWCAQKVENFGKGTDVSVWFICIPRVGNLRRNLRRDEILLNDLEQLRVIDIQNIALSEPYAPFQIGQNLYNFIDGFPVDENQKQFLIDALNLDSKEYYDYKELYENKQPKI